MAYATRDGLTTYGVSAEALTNVLTDAQDRALIAASSRADSYLSQHYTLPLKEPYPVTLVDAVCRIAAFNLLSVRGFNPEGQAEIIVHRNDEAISWLKLVGSRGGGPEFIDSTGRGDDGGSFVVSPQPTSRGGYAAGTPKPRGW